MDGWRTCDAGCGWFRRVRRQKDQAGSITEKFVQADACSVRYAAGKGKYFPNMGKYFLFAETFFRFGFWGSLFIGFTPLYW